MITMYSLHSIHYDSLYGYAALIVFENFTHYLGSWTGSKIILFSVTFASERGFISLLSENISETCHFGFR